MTTYTIIISKDGQTKETLTGQTSDLKALGAMHRLQSNSVDHALRYEGWKVQVTNEQTGQTDFWKPYSRK